MNEIVTTKQMSKERDFIFIKSLRHTELGRRTWCGDNVLSYTDHQFVKKVLKKENKKLFEKNKEILSQIDALIVSHHELELAADGKIELPFLLKLLEKNVPERFFSEKTLLVDLSKEEVLPERFPLTYPEKFYEVKYVVMRYSALSYIIQIGNKFSLKLIEKKYKDIKKTYKGWDGNVHVEYVQEPYDYLTTSRIGRSEIIKLLKDAIATQGGTCSEEEYIDAWAKRLLKEAYQ
jgi:hypothetical protein